MFIVVVVVGVVSPEVDIPAVEKLVSVSYDVTNRVSEVFPCGRVTESLVVKNLDTILNYKL